MDAMGEAEREETGPMAGRENEYGGIGSNGHGPADGVFDELEALSDEELESLVAGVEDEGELRELLGEPELDEALVESTDEPVAAAEPRRRRSDDERELVALRLFPDREYAAERGDFAASADRADDAWDNGAGGDGSRLSIARALQLLEPVEDALRAAGFYAYGTLDDESRWTVAVDDEAGRVDVRVEPDGFVLDLRATSPGRYADVEHPFRRKRMERAVRETLPRIARGFLDPHQHAEWDDVDQGVAVRVRYLVPFDRARDMGRIVRQRLPELDDLLTLVEQRVTE
jgi:hypothetical protein